MKSKTPILAVKSFLSNHDRGLLLLVLLGFVSRLSWIAYTNFTEEDAFITFRIARHLAEGVGFVYNSGEQVLGTTSPLFALILAGWIGFSKDVILGARIFNLVAMTAACFLLLLALRATGSTRPQQAGVLIVFALSSKLILLDSGGMETALVIFLMIASWVTFVRQHLTWTGILLGLLLLTRIDLILWPVAILLVELVSHPRKALRIGMLIFLIVLPWAVFSTIYFGSPIPHTVAAKWVAYAQNDHSPYTNHLLAAINFMSPFDQYKEYISFRNLLAWMTLLVAAWQAVRISRDKTMLLMVLFVVLDIARLVLTRATFFNRYFVPALVAVLILFGMGLGQLWDSSRAFPIFLRVFYSIALFSLVVMGLVFGGYNAELAKMKQEYRHDGALGNIGLWLRQNAPPSATVLLEPLGYIGYYSERIMLDEVGLVTPQVVALKGQGISANEYFRILQPDYYVLHCDDAMRLQGQIGEVDWGLSERYTLAVTFNPLNYDVLLPDYSSYGALQRNACYDVWRRNGDPE
ncbi:MAG: hypothetical protein ABIJ39_12485 [Chloroflexota bacterium]